MQKFNLQAVIEHYNLDTDEVAKALFPHARYQKLALNRILKGEAVLDTEQLEALSKLTGVLVHDLFFISEDWKGSSENGHLVFIKGEYKVKLNYNGAFLSVYKQSELIHQEVSGKNMSLLEFIEYINKVINNQNLKQNEQQTSNDNQIGTCH